MRTKTMLGLLATLSLGVGTALADDTYKIDPAHTRLGFSVRHLGINSVKGHFDTFEGTVTLNNKVITGASCTIQVKSINTGVKERDDHLRSEDFFDAAKHETITFKTKSIEDKDGQTLLVADFTIRGVTKEVRLPVKLSGPVKDQQGDTRIGLEGKLTINRKDYGIKFNTALESGVAMVGEEGAIEVNIEAVLQKDGK